MTSFGRRGWFLATMLAAGGERSVAQESAVVEVSVRTAASARLVVGERRERVGDTGAAVRLPAGDLAVHFAADAAGKPRSLAVVAPAGSQVRAVVARAAALVTTPVDVAAGVPVAAGSPLRAAPGEAPGAVRVAGIWGAWAAAATFGPAVRIGADGSHYRGVYDAAAGEFRLVRRIGKDEFVVAAAQPALAPRFGAELVLQAEGFRLQLACDDQIVLQAFDGALDRGLVGWWSEGKAELVALTQAPAVGERASTALVQRAGVATLVASTTVPPGALAVLELCLDRPHALQPPGLSLGVGVDLPGRGQFVSIDRNGMAVGELQLPSGAALGGQAYLARFLLFDAEGVQAAGRTPAVAVTLPVVPH